MNIIENGEGRVILKKKREKSVRNRHPWVFSGAIDRVEGRVSPGDMVALYTAAGDFVAKGFFNPHSQIRMRLLTFAPEPLDVGFFDRKIEQAAALRQPFFDENTNAWRLIHSEGDSLPGLVVDRYADTLVVQFNTLGMHRLREALTGLLQRRLTPVHILDRSDPQALRNEGLAAAPVSLLAEDAIPPVVEILENGHRFKVDVLGGQKTGFFLDQRDNRRLAGRLCRGGAVLNCFAYTGGFSVYAAAAGAQCTSVEVSNPALTLARENFSLNGLDTAAHEFICANVFEYLRAVPEDHFEMIILDPPAFVKHKAHLNKGARGYKDINRLAISKVRSGGYVLSCSCSAFVDWDLFRKIVYSAAQESGRQVQIIAQPAQPPDHPINIFHPEGEYLKTLLLRVLA